MRLSDVQKELGATILFWMTELQQSIFSLSQGFISRDAGIESHKGVNSALRDSS